MVKIALFSEFLTIKKKEPKTAYLEINVRQNEKSNINNGTEIQRTRVEVSFGDGERTLMDILQGVSVKKGGFLSEQ